MGKPIQINLLDSKDFIVDLDYREPAKRVTLYDLIYDFAFEIYGHEETAKIKTLLYFKLKSKK